MGYYSEVMIAVTKKDFKKVEDAQAKMTENLLDYVNKHDYKENNKDTQKSKVIIKKEYSKKRNRRHNRDSCRRCTMYISKIRIKCRRSFRKNSNRFASTKR